VNVSSVSLMCARRATDVSFAWLNTPDTADILARQHMYLHCEYDIGLPVMIVIRIMQTDCWLRKKSYLVK